jgi:hypothetical protein
MSLRRRGVAVVASLSAAISAAAACAQVLGVEPGVLQPGGTDGGRDGTLDALPIEAASAVDGAADVIGEDSGSPVVGDDATSPVEASSGDAADAADDVHDATPCDPADSDATTGGFSAWYPVGDAIFSSGTSLTGLSPAPGEIAFYGTRRDGIVVMSRASAPFGPAAWSVWSAITTDTTTFADGVPVAAVARGGGRTDVFVVRGDGVLLSTTAGSDQPWSVVGDGAPGLLSQRIGLVLSGSGAATLHVLGASSGAIYETSQTSDGGFSAWQRVGIEDGGTRFASSAPVAVVARSVVSMNAFGVGTDGLAYVASRTLAPLDTGWSEWSALESNTFAPATVLTASSHNASEFDLFAVNPQGTPSAILHNENWPDGGWVGWFELGGQVLDGTHVVAVTSMDLYVIDPTSEVLTLPFEQASFRWAPEGWMPISACGHLVAATSIEAVRGEGTAIELAAVDTSGRVFVTDRPDSP